MRLSRLFLVVLAPSILLAWSCGQDLGTEEPVSDIHRTSPAPGSGPKTGAPIEAPDEPDQPDPDPVDAGPSDDAAQPASAALVITEIMYDPVGPEPANEWFEIYNAGGTARSLKGLVLRDGGNRTHTIAADVAVEPGAYAVIARDHVAAGVDAIYDYGKGLSTSEGVQLSNNSTGSIAILDGAIELAHVPFGTYKFTNVAGHSAQRQSAGDGASAWCLTTSTPGKPNATCGDAGP